MSPTPHTSTNATSKQPDRTFPGKNAPWYIAMVIAVVGALCASCVVCFRSMGALHPISWIMLLITSASALLAALTVFSNRVELYSDYLSVVYAGTRSNVPYNHIRYARRTKRPWAGTANSLDRIIIHATPDSDSIVSVQDNDALLTELQNRCRP